MSESQNWSLFIQLVSKSYAFFVHPFIQPPVLSLDILSNSWKEEQQYFPVHWMLSLECTERHDDRIQNYLIFSEILSSSPLRWLQSRASWHGHSQIDVWLHIQMLASKQTHLCQKVVDTGKLGITGRGSVRYCRKYIESEIRETRLVPFLPATSVVISLNFSFSSCNLGKKVGAYTTYFTGHPKKVVR